jgi:hypothetical protein
LEKAQMHNDTVYAIFDDCDDCCYLCIILDEIEEQYIQSEPMNDWDWEEFLNND